MAIKGFDYKGFAKSMAEQAKKLVPNELPDYAKQYLVQTVKNFAFLTGEALYNDKSINISAEEAAFMTQIISEWTFHKSVDLANSGIEPKYWDAIMEKIGFTSYEVIKQGILRKWSQDEVLETVEQNVIKVYKECIENLCEDKNISEETAEIAKSQSNIDKMAEEAELSRKFIMSDGILDDNDKRFHLSRFAAMQMGIIFGLVGLGYLCKPNPIFLTYINRFSSIIYLVLLLPLPIVTFCIDKFLFDKNIKKKLIELAIIFAVICLGANIDKLILRYQYGLTGTVFSSILYLLALFLYNNIKLEMENDKLKEIFADKLQLM